jgi:hypothetical protein
MLDMLFSLRARMLAATLSGFHPAFMMDFEDEARPDAYFTHLSHVAVGKSAKHSSVQSMVLQQSTTRP